MRVALAARVAHRQDFGVRGVLAHDEVVGEERDEQPVAPAHAYLQLITWG